MTQSEEREMHELAEQLVVLTAGVGWEAMRYMEIGRTMERLTTFCATCDCQAKRNQAAALQPEPEEAK